MNKYREECKAQLEEAAGTSHDAFQLAAKLARLSAWIATEISERGMSELTQADAIDVAKASAIMAAAAQKISDLTEGAFEALSIMANPEEPAGEVDDDQS